MHIFRKQTDSVRLI